MSGKPIKEGYQPKIVHVNYGYQPSDRRGYQPTKQPLKNVVPPSTGSSVKPVKNKK